MEKVEKLIIAGGSSLCKTPPFVYVEDKMLKEIEQNFPESKEYKKFYVITTEAYANGELLNVVNIVDDSTRKEVQDFCNKKSKEKIKCRFSKVIRSFDGNIEKYWLEDFYMKRIAEHGRVARRNFAKRKLKRKSLYSTKSILVERCNSEIPNWFIKSSKTRVFFNGLSESFLKNDSANFIYSHKNIGILKIKDARRTPFYTVLKKFNKINFLFKNQLGIICINANNLNYEKFIEIRNSKFQRYKISHYEPLKYFRFEEVVILGDNLLLFFIQDNVIPKDLNGITMDFFMKMIYNHLLTYEFDISFKNKFK